ncbi:hypothetical protein BHU72_06765 [Desulfuribacillus stibiiarsenatis]|uniref:Methyl-accepting transducer domain-containing protein n=1 Tax=Desulfuribacillus stibiiarsenatis TaxID=1390249 RepID=A0A1E5L418_9FIRM|nr:hypothetical protein [Desulfuribacillus stibiiarsenatis]OEH84890.1 hypothetical protein BHU72_06765 [Desulfuribacillus stibiiarsenatis]
MQWVRERCIEVIGQIDQVVEGTQDIYGSIYDKLPMLEEEIQLTSKEVDILLDFFLHSDAVDTNQANEDALHLSQVLHKVFAEVSIVSEHMADETEFKRIMERFLAKEDNSQISVRDLMKIIPIIKNKISDIELISMNAIIYSSRLGEEGRAFEVISDHIMGISNKVAEYYDDMEIYATDLEQWNDDFTKSLDQIIHYHRTLTSEQLQNFQSMHEKVFESLKTIRDLLHNIIMNLQNSVEPVQHLMGQIQIQDIIQQSLENLNKIIRDVCNKIDEDAGKANLSKEDELNMLTFNYQGLALAVRLIIDIEGRLVESLTDIEKTVIESKTKIDELLEEGSLMVDLLSGERQGNKNVIQLIFEDVDKFLFDFQVELTNICKETDELASVEISFMKHMRGIEKMVMKIEKAMNQLSKLNLFSRIELARINARDSSSFVNEINNISEAVIKEVKDNEEFVARLRVQLEQDLQTFQEVLGSNRTSIQEMLVLVDTSLSQMDIIRTLVMQAIQPIGYSGKNMATEIGNIERKINQRYALHEIIEEIKVNLMELEGEIETKYQAALDKHQISHWENQSPELMELLNRLTTHYERTVAKLTWEDTSLDIGEDGGELTLF